MTAVLKKGDIVVITVDRKWSDAVGAAHVLHQFTEEDYTGDARAFIAKLVSMTDSEGLWVEGPRKKNTTSEHERVGIKLLIPWVYILAVRSAAVSQADRKRMGF